MSVAWTHTLAYDDVRAMLDCARQGMPLAEWRECALAASRLFASDRRTTQLRYATCILRMTEGHVSDATLLKHLGAGNEAAVHDLVFGRYLAAVPVALTVARALWGNVRHDRTFTRANVDAAVRTALPTVTAATAARTRSSFVTEYARAGVLRVAPGGLCTLLDRDPAPEAVLDLARDDLARRREAADAWLARSSAAGLVFALTPDRMTRLLERLVASGDLVRSYYNGEPRVIAA